MCRRTVLIGAVVAAIGVGFLLSCLIDRALIRVLIGAILLGIGLVLTNRR